MDDVPKRLVIPTRYRSKIAHTHSFPLGAEVISDCLAGMPQFERVELTFSSRYRFDPAATSYGVLQAYCQRLYNFTDLDRARIESGWLGLWSITVLPVPRDKRHKIKTKLISEALPALRAWIGAQTDIRRFYGSNLAFWFGEETGLLTQRQAAKMEPIRD